MKRIKIDKHFSFMECRGDSQRCSLCECKMKGKIGLTINKPRTDGNGYNIWLCLECSGKVPSIIERARLENRDELILEML